MLKIKRIYRYSESFRQQVLDELSLGIYTANGSHLQCLLINPNSTYFRTRQSFFNHTF
ncbi:hypothetical protein AQBE111736_08030 [Aquirufa beregesia]